MTIRKQALLLVNSFKIKTLEINLKFYETTDFQAKQCALICCDKLIKHTMPCCEFGGDITNETQEYWYLVKEEIQLLFTDKSKKL